MYSNIWLVASGKGGVGKSTICAGLAYALAKKNRRVVVVDGDIGLRCADLMLGMQDRVVYDFADCLGKRCALDDALLAHREIPTLFLLPAAQDLKVSDIKNSELERLARTLSRRFDYVLIDCPAGVGKNFKCWTSLAQGCVLVTTPDDASIRDVEKMSAILFKRGVAETRLCVNRVDEQLVQTGEMYQPREIAAYLDIPLLAVLPESREITRANLVGKTIAQCGDKAIVTAVERMALRFQGADAPMECYDRKLTWKQRLINAWRGGDKA